MNWSAMLSNFWFHQAMLWIVIISLGISLYMNPPDD